MHTTKLVRGWIAIHEGDFSGDIEFYEREYDDEPVAKIPFDVIAQLVGEAVRTAAQHKLEDAELHDLIQGLDPRMLRGGPAADAARVSQRRGRSPLKAAQSPHAFTGRRDRDCTRCGRTDRHLIHVKAVLKDAKR